MFLFCFKRQTSQTSTYSYIRLYPLVFKEINVTHQCACHHIQVRFGPDVEWLPKPSDAIYNTAAFGEEDGFDYRVDPNRSVAFGDAIRR